MSLAYDATLRHGDRRSLDAGDVYSEAGFELVNAGDFPFGSYGTQASEFPGSTALFNDNDEGVTVLSSTAGDLFHILSIDLAELIIGAAQHYAVEFTGAQIGGSTLTQRFVLDG